MFDESTYICKPLVLFLLLLIVADRRESSTCPLMVASRRINIGVKRLVIFQL